MSQVRLERDSVGNITKYEEETLEGIRAGGVLSSLNRTG